MKIDKFIIFIVTLLSIQALQAQPDRWQQGIKYKMDIDFDVKDHKYKGNQYISYFNNSPDTLHHVYYHLFYNAFQPGSMMDVRSRTISDPDGRVGDRISKLTPDEYGYQKILSLTQDGKKVSYEIVGTILEVELSTPILPGSTTNFFMKFEAQVPVQIRRAGRDNKEGIDYSMAQWYPKMCEYDYQGWHANPYVGREFYGVWGKFEVNITIDKNYIIGGTGVLQNPEEIGYGYQKNPEKKIKRKGKTNTWRFIADNVHDFMWAADPDYIVKRRKSNSGVMLYFVYEPKVDSTNAWTKLPEVMDNVFDYANEHFGKYPYPMYSFVQGGDGGMEYPMATLVTGKRNFRSLVGVCVHESMHSWYQMVMGFNESLYPWMDEGFTSYASTYVMNYLKSINVFENVSVMENPFERTYKGYVRFANSGFEEALSTHADHYTTNSAYGVGSYTKGQVFLRQLEYIVGDENLANGLLTFYNKWKFKHPNPNDFIRVIENESDIELDWYKEYWINTTRTIDYSVDTVIVEGKQTNIILQKKGVMPMPLDVLVVFEDGSRTYYNIPLRIMRGHKPLNGAILLEDWPWTNNEYIIDVNTKRKVVKSVVLDPLQKMADINRDNNTWKDN